jgi:VanZ family protein
MMGIIFWWSTQTVLPGSAAMLVWWDFVIKKIAHLFEYGLLFFSLQRALNWNKLFDQKKYLYVFLWVLLYAMSDELHQSFTPGRHAKIDDVGFDMLGAFLVFIRLKKFI